MAIGSVVDVCGDPPPAGWVTMAVKGTCARFAGSTFTGVTIKKIAQ